MKLWKVTVNDWDWDAPKTFYAASNREAEEIGNRYPASDKVRHAGNFRPDRAKWLLANDEYRFYNPYPI